MFWKNGKIWIFFTVSIIAFEIRTNNNFCKLCKIVKFTKYGALTYYHPSSSNFRPFHSISYRLRTFLKKWQISNFLALSLIVSERTFSKKWQNHQFLQFSQNFSFTKYAALTYIFTLVIRKFPPLCSISYRFQIKTFFEKMAKFSKYDALNIITIVIPNYLLPFPR